jgi:hypothetical protein
MGIGTDAESQEMIDITPQGDQKSARPKPKTLDDLVSAYDKPEPQPAVELDAEAPAAPKDERQASRGAEIPQEEPPPADEELGSSYEPFDDGQPSLLAEPPPPVRNEATATVTVFTPGVRRPESMEVSVASAYLLDKAGQVKNARGAEWIKSVIQANPWTATHRPTADGLRDHMERCTNA